MPVPEDNDKTAVGSELRLTLPSHQKAMEIRQQEDEALSVGTKLAEFEITGLIGIGGFGIVYLAYDISLGRHVAIKEYMPSSLASRKAGNSVSAKSEKYAATFAAGLSSFMNEARMLALFDHPSLVKVYRCWEANGTAYMVMPYHEGETLKQVRTEMIDPPSQEWLKGLLIPLMDALQLLHAKCCFHRDIAPDNILILKDGTPVLLDFGSARLVIGDMTRNLTVILKAGYAPIEQYTGDPHMPQGAWTDIYALGAVIYYAIAGVPPAESVRRLVNDTNVPLETIGKGRYSEGFLRSIDQAISVKAVQRPQSISELRRMMALDEGPGLGPGAKQYVDVAPSQVKSGGHGVRRLLIGFALVFAAIGVGISLIWDSPPEQKHSVVAPTPPTGASSSGSAEPRSAEKQLSAVTVLKPVAVPVAENPVQKRSAKESLRPSQARKISGVQRQPMDAASSTERAEVRRLEEATRSTSASTSVAAKESPALAASYDGTYNGRLCNLVSGQVPFCWPVALRVRHGVAEGYWISGTKKGARATANGTIAADGSFHLMLTAWAPSDAPVKATLHGRIDDAAITASGQWDNITGVSGNWKRLSAAEEASVAKYKPPIVSYDGTYNGRLCNLVSGQVPFCWPVALRVLNGMADGSWISGTKKGARATANGTIAADGSFHLMLTAWAPGGAPTDAVLNGRINDSAITASGEWKTGGAVTGDWKRTSSQ